MSDCCTGFCNWCGSIIAFCCGDNGTDNLRSGAESPPAQDEKTTVEKTTWVYYTAKEVPEDK